MKRFYHATYGELIPLLHWAYSNSENDGVARDYGCFLYISFCEASRYCCKYRRSPYQKGMFVQDKPKFRKSTLFIQKRKRAV